ncbi:MAG: fimbrillin family protein [Duncaniella sp.]|nr:fimbrillin family protein [Duncaniella sp.]
MKKIFLLAAASLLLAACDNNDDNPQSSYQAAKITAKIDDSNQSRAINTSWDPGDVIGIHSIVGKDDEKKVIGPYFNVEYTTLNGDGTFTGDPLYFYKPMTLFAYYPFGKVGEADGPDADGIISANTLPANQMEKEQRRIDFLWDSENGFTAREPNVDFTFTHRMSKITFTFRDTPSTDPKQEVLVKNIRAYEILGLGFEGTFDTYTGVCAINDPEVNDSIKIETDKAGKKFYDEVEIADNVALDPIILFPQSPGNDKVKLRLYLDELKVENHEHQIQTYTCTLTFGDGELKPGYSYKYTIRVTKVGLIVGEMSIEPWKVERDVKLTSTIDGSFIEGEWPDEITQ